MFADRAPRCRVSVQVLCTIPGEGDGAEFLEAELVNVSSSGMLVDRHPLPIGAEVEFQFKLDDGVVALSGRAEVVRTVASRRGWVSGSSRWTAPRAARTPPDRSRRRGARDSDRARVRAAAVEFEHGSVRVRLSAATARFFTYNPLLHVGVGGCFLPAETDVPLGTGYQWTFSTARTACSCAARPRWRRSRIGGLACALSRSNGAPCRLCAPRSRSWRAPPTG